MLIVVLVEIGAAVVLRSHRPKGVEVLGPVALPGLLGLVLIPVIARGGICSSLFRTPGGLVVEVERCFACCAVGVIAQREDRAGVVTDEGGSRIVRVGMVVRYIPGPYQNRIILRSIFASENTAEDKGGHYQR